jgi:hypothetical protein
METDKPPPLWAAGLSLLLIATLNTNNFFAYHGTKV